jgi:hypothetical protein
MRLLSGGGWKLTSQGKAWFMKWEIMHTALQLNYMLNREWLNWKLVIIDCGNERSNESHLVIDSHFHKKTTLETIHDSSRRLLIRPFRVRISNYYYRILRKD